jgi:hypothetical protein
VVDSFIRPEGAPKAVAESRLRSDSIESVDDNPDFADLVHEQLHNLNPEATSHVLLVPSLQVSSLSSASTTCAVMIWTGTLHAGRRS